jgi:DNA-binding phage protein
MSDSGTTPPVGSRWLAISADKAAAIRVLQAELDEARRDLDTTLTIASAYYNPTELARATGLSRETIYTSLRRASA